MLEKLYIKSRQVCKVTFELPEDIKAESVCLVGEFNDWNPTAAPMKRDKKGAFRLILELEPGREYQFRYLVDDKAWHNDGQADAYVPNGFGEDNSVVIIPTST